MAKTVEAAFVYDVASEFHALDVSRLLIVREGQEVLHYYRADDEGSAVQRVTPRVAVGRAIAWSDPFGETESEVHEYLKESGLAEAYVVGPLPASVYDELDRGLLRKDGTYREAEHALLKLRFDFF